MEAREREAGEGRRVRVGVKESGLTLHGIRVCGNTKGVGEGVCVCLCLWRPPPPV